MRARQYGAEAFQQQRQRQRQLHTEAGYLTLSQTKTQSFPEKELGNVMFSSSDFEPFAPKPTFPTERAPHSISPLTPGCSFITQKQLSFWNKPLCFASHLLLYDATLTSMSAYTMFNDPATHCDWLRNMQCFIRPEMSQPYKNKNKKLKAEDGISVYTTTTTHT